LFTAGLESGGPAVGDKDGQGGAEVRCPTCGRALKENGQGLLVCEACDERRKEMHGPTSVTSFWGLE